MVDLRLHNVLDVQESAELMSTVKGDKIFEHKVLKQARSLPKLKLKVWDG